MNRGKEIWVLGEQHESADKSFLWSEPIPNIADADIIIINLGTLTKDVLERYKNQEIDLRSDLVDKFMDKGTLVFIIGEEKTRGLERVEYGLNPLYLKFASKPSGKKIRYNSKHPFAAYLKYVQQYDYEILQTTTTPHLQKHLTTFKEIELLSSHRISNNSGQTLGGTCVVQNHNFKKISGNIFILPPTKPELHIESVSIIIACLRNDYEIPPSWWTSINVEGVSAIQNIINRLNEEKQTIEDSIKLYAQKEQQLTKYVGLLYSQGSQLEEIVKDAFLKLGFDEIGRNRGLNEEDWIINLTSIKGAKFGVIEVKGKDKTASLTDISQCHKWVEDYLRMDPSISTKGIFIINQFRLKNFVESIDQRNHFPPNALTYAQNREICIIPTHVLFNAVNEALKRSSKPNRASIEESIYDTNGVLDSIKII